MSGNQSYYPDGRQKDSQTLAADLRNFTASIKDLQSHVDDPSNILGKAIGDLEKYAQAFQKIMEGNEPVDNIEVPPESFPTTRDKNEMYIPDLGPFSPPNPLLPDRWKKDLETSLESSDDGENTIDSSRPNIYPRLQARSPRSTPPEAAKSRRHPYSTTASLQCRLFRQMARISPALSPAGSLTISPAA